MVSFLYPIRGTDKKHLKALLDQGLSQRKIAATLDCSQGSVRYWLRKYGLRTRRGPHGSLPTDMQRERSCACGETDPSKFYGHKMSICAACHNAYNLRKGREKRARAITYLGGKCSNPECGFMRYNSALQVHHLNPSEKDPSFASYRGWAWSKLKVELDKCILLCACCHAAVHSGELKVIWV